MAVLKENWHGFDTKKQPACEETKNMQWLYLKHVERTSAGGDSLLRSKYTNKLSNLTFPRTGHHVRYLQQALLSILQSNI